MAASAFKPFLDELEEDLTCSICHEIFTDPKCLRCFHSFCAKCIVGWYRTSEVPGTEGFDCPTCRTRMNLPGGDVSKLTPSFYLGSLPRLFSAMKIKSDQEQSMGESNCEGCEKPCRLIAFCPQCDCLICGDCVDAHKNLKLLREEHHPTLFSDFGQENVNSFIRNQMVCKEKHHEKSKLEYYCKEKTCKKCVCQKCATLYHQNHQMQSLEEAAEDVKQRLLNEMDTMEKLKGYYEDDLRQSKGNMERIQREVDSAKQKVQEAEELVCRMVREHARAMINDLHQTLRDQKEANEEEQNDINAEIQRLLDCKGYSEAMVTRNAACELIESKDALLTQSAALRKTTSVLCSKPLKRNMSIDYVTGQLMKSLDDIGKIVKSYVDPSSSTIEPIKDARCGFLNMVEVVTRNTEGQVCHTSELVEVHVEDADGSEVTTQVCDKQNGKYVVSYRATVPQPYIITATVRGRPIQNSPKYLDTLSTEAEYQLKRFEADDTGLLNGPQGLAISDTGEVAIADFGNHRVQVFSSEGKYLRKFGTNETEKGHLVAPFSVAFIEDSIVVCDVPDDDGSRIQEFGLDGEYVRTLVTPERMMVVTDCCIKDGTFIVVCCKGDNKGNKPRIKVLNRRGELCREFDMEKNEWPWSIEYGNGQYYVSYGNKNYIRIFNEDGICLRKFGKKGTGDGQFNTICGLAVFGPDKILACDCDNSRVQVLTQEGRYVMSFGGFGAQVGSMFAPVDVVVTNDGRALVLDYNCGRIHVWSQGRIQWRETRVAHRRP